MSRTIGVVLRPDVPQALEGLSCICEEAPDATILVEAVGAGDAELPAGVIRVEPHEVEQDVELVVVFGGDGTMIRAARMLPNRLVPILGVNLGRIGFLTEVTFEEVRRGFRMALAGELPHSDRMRLDIQVRRNGDVTLEERILNDVVLSRPAQGTITTFRVRLEDSLITSIRGDGVIVSTPTGSTAYAMAAGGSILTPELEAIAVTPVCPYQLNQRPLVLNPTGALLLSIVDEGNVYATCDGRSSVEFLPGDVMRIERSPVGTRLLTVPWRDYFEMLRVKLRWGEN